MKHIAIAFVLSSLFICSCATKQPTIQPGAHLLSVTDAQPGSSYELGVYVVAPGDTVSQICMRFQILIQDFLAINPDLHPARLKIGQKVRVYERIKQ